MFTPSQAGIKSGSLDCEETSTATTRRGLQIHFGHAFFLEEAETKDLNLLRWHTSLASSTFIILITCSPVTGTPLPLLGLQMVKQIHQLAPPSFPHLLAGVGSANLLIYGPCSTPEIDAPLIPCELVVRYFCRIPAIACGSNGSECLIYIH